MRKITFSPAAKKDLDGIWQYTLDKWGVEQAELYVRQLWAVINGQFDKHNISIDVGYVRKGYRKIKSGSHIIFFKKGDEVIDVMRILHQKMDFDRHL